MGTAQRLRKHDLLLIDAGAEIDCYCADITRTFPVSGRFSGRQKALYEIVLEAQLAAIAAVSPGASFNDPHEAAVRAITAGLKDLKLLKGSVDSLIEKTAYRKFFVHRTSHWLGLDVHDVGEYRVGSTPVGAIAPDGTATPRTHRKNRHPCQVDYRFHQTPLTASAASRAQPG